MVTTQRRFLIVYATREGQTRKIAEHVAATLRARNASVDVVDAGAPPEDVSFDWYDTVILAASVHAGKHEREMVDFVRQHSSKLSNLRTAFLSVSLTEAGSEDRSASPEVRSHAAAEVKRTIDDFFAETGLHPSRVVPVAGALLYRQYGLLKRLAMRVVAGRQGGSTDTSRDHEYTDWEALDAFADQLLADQ